MRLVQPEGAVAGDDAGQTVRDNLLGLTGHRKASALSGIPAEESQDPTF